MINNKNRFLPAAAGLMTVFLGCAAVPAAALAEDLSSVVGTALSSNPDVAEARNRWRARRDEVREAEGGFLPSVDLNAGIGYEYTDSPGTRARGIDSNELTRKELGLNVRQMLFDGWGTESEVERQKARTDSAAARLLASPRMCSAPSRIGSPRVSDRPLPSRASRVPGRRGRRSGIVISVRGEAPTG